MLDRTWSLADAKSRLSEVLNLADERAQIITRRGRRYVVLDSESYELLAGRRATLKDLLLAGPSLEGIELERDRSTSREIDL